MYLREVLPLADISKIHGILQGVISFQDVENLIDSKVSDIEDAIKSFPELLNIKTLRRLYGRGRKPGRSH